MDSTLTSLDKVNRFRSGLSSIFVMNLRYRDADGQPLHDFVIEDNVIKPGCKKWAFKASS